MTTKTINNKIRESSCSFEVCKLLKERGCWINDFYFTTYYDYNGNPFRIGTIGQIGVTPDDWAKDVFQRPTHALAIEWINENFDDIKIAQYFRTYKEDVFRGGIEYRTYKRHKGSANWGHATFKDADSALMHTLENLITRPAPKTIPIPNGIDRDKTG